MSQAERYYEIDGVSMSANEFFAAVEAMNESMENRPTIDGVELLALEESESVSIESSIDMSDYSVIKNDNWFDHQKNMKFARVEMLAMALGVSKQGLNQLIIRKYPSAKVKGFKGVNIWHGSDRDGDLDPRHKDGGLSGYLMQVFENALSKGIAAKHVDLWNVPKFGSVNFPAAIKRAASTAKTRVNQRRTKANKRARKSDVESIALSVVKNSQDE